MKVVLTGSSGRIGRAIFGALAGQHDVTGVDRNAFSTTHVVGDCADLELQKRVLDGADALIHTAGPHAPHVGHVTDAEFERINVDGTRSLYETARASGVRHFIYTSTTALYGHAIGPNACTWVTEETPPQPKSIYHRTNLAAEQWLEGASSEALPVRVIRMSRCFPELAPEMATYRLHRGVDARDVGRAHALALGYIGERFARFVISGATPFLPRDCEELARDAPAVIRRRVPRLADAFDARGWALPLSIDRVYDSSEALNALGWTPQWGWEEVLAQLDRSDLEVLSPASLIANKAE